MMRSNAKVEEHLRLIEYLLQNNPTQKEKQQFLDKLNTLLKLYPPKENFFRKKILSLQTKITNNDVLNHH